MRSRLFWRRVILFSLLPGAALAATIEERLQALEERVQALAAENATLRQQLGATGDAKVMVVKPAGREASLSVGGFLQGQAEFGDAPDTRWTARDRFFFRRARVFVAGSFAENFDFKAELDLQGNTLSAGTGHAARANEIFVNWNKYPGANLRFGQLKPAFGAEQLLSDTKMITIERALVTERLADGRQMAVAAAGRLLDGVVNYYAVIGQGNGANVSTNDNEQFQKSVRVTVAPRTGDAGKLVLGVNALQTTDDGVAKPDLGLAGGIFTGKRTLWGVDAQWTRGPLDLSAEYLRGTFQPRGGVPAREFDAHGWHVTGAYYFPSTRVQLFVRAEEFDPNSDAGGEKFETLILGANYLLKGDDIRFGVNYVSGDAPGAERQARLLTRVQVVF